MIGRFWLFSEPFTPQGGIDDLAGRYRSLQAAKTAAQILDEESGLKLWHHIFDCEDGKRWDLIDGQWIMRWVDLPNDSAYDRCERIGEFLIAPARRRSGTS